jgi:hypothetical protein
MKTMTLLCALLLSGCADWSARDYSVLAGHVSCAFVDGYQTHWATRHGFNEKNPLMGNHPTDNQMLAAKTINVAFVWDVAEAAGDEKYQWLTVSLVPCEIAVVHNALIGAKGF